MFAPPDPSGLCVRPVLDFATPDAVRWVVCVDGLQTEHSGEFEWIAHLTGEALARISAA